jgi:hypothetical protein
LGRGGSPPTNPSSPIQLEVLQVARMTIANNVGMST